MIEIDQYHTVVKSETTIFDLIEYTSLINYCEKRYTSIIWAVDKSVYNVHLSKFSASKNILQIDSGERIKTFQYCSEIIEKLSQFSLDKNSIIIAVGGGALTDLIGFIASIYLRGIRLGIIPTTVLGMVDAGLGGKNGINLGNFKNQIGTTYQPDFVAIDKSFINSLSTQEISNGFAEIIKYGIIFDANLFNEILENSITSFSTNQYLQSRIIGQCINHKSSIVVKDPLDMNERRLLNYGHTIGHAIEKIYGLSHGEAIALGMIIDSHISVHELLSDSILIAKTKLAIENYELPLTLNIQSDAVFTQIMKDKKRNNDHIDYVLIETIGSAIIWPLAIDKIKYYLDKAIEEKWI